MTSLQEGQMIKQVVHKPTVIPEYLNQLICRSNQKYLLIARYLMFNQYMSQNSYKSQWFGYFNTNRSDQNSVSKSNYNRCPEQQLLHHQLFILYIISATSITYSYTCTVNLKWRTTVWMLSAIIPAFANCNRFTWYKHLHLTLFILSVLFLSYSP